MISSRYCEEPLALPQGPNQRWSLNFVADSFSEGRRFRILAVVDDFTCECLTLVANTSLSGARVARELDAPIARHAKPMQNGFVESFNGRLRDECLNENLLASLSHSRAVLAAWKVNYRHFRPHSDLGGATSANDRRKLWSQVTSPRHRSNPLSLRQQAVKTVVDRAGSVDLFALLKIAGVDRHYLGWRSRESYPMGYGTTCIVCGNWK